MTLSPFIIYLWGIADNLQILLITVGIAAGLVTLFLALFVSIELDGFADEEAAQYRKPFKLVLITALVCSIGATLTPSSKTIAIMVVAPAIVNSKPIQQDLPEVYSLAVDALKSSLKDVAIEKSK